LQYVVVSWDKTKTSYSNGILRADSSSSNDIVGHEAKLGKGAKKDHLA